MTMGAARKDSKKVSASGGGTEGKQRGVERGDDGDRVEEDANVRAPDAKGRLVGELIFGEAVGVPSVTESWSQRLAAESTKKKSPERRHVRRWARLMLSHKKKKLNPDNASSQVKMVPEAWASPMYARQPNKS